MMKSIIVFVLITTISGCCNEMTFEFYWYNKRPEDRMKYDFIKDVITYPDSIKTLSIEFGYTEYYKRYFLNDSIEILKLIKYIKENFHCDIYTYGDERSTRMHNIYVEDKKPK